MLHTPEVAIHLGVEVDKGSDSLGLKGELHMQVDRRTSACVKGREQLVEYQLLAASAFLFSIPISRCNGTYIGTNTTGNSNYWCSLSTHMSHIILDGLV